MLAEDMAMEGDGPSFGSVQAVPGVSKITKKKSLLLSRPVQIRRRSAKPPSIDIYDQRKVRKMPRPFIMSFHFVYNIIFFIFFIFSRKYRQ
jgi:hypothetical protein